jgi:retinol dehydrogenase-12
MSNPPGVLRSQFIKLPYPSHKFTGQTIIVTGSNVGMGLEAARHFARLDAAKVVLAVRTRSKGEAAKASIEASTKRRKVVEVWELDLASYASVKAFAAKAQRLERLDVVIGNAGMFTWTWELVEGDEKTVTVNVVSTFLLSLLLLPKLRETAVKTKKASVLSLTGSFTHFMTTFPERDNANIFEELARKDVARMDDRYVYFLEAQDAAWLIGVDIRSRKSSSCSVFAS